MTAEEDLRHSLAVEMTANAELRRQLAETKHGFHQAWDQLQIESAQHANTAAQLEAATQREQDLNKALGLLIAACVSPDRSYDSARAFNNARKHYKEP